MRNIRIFLLVALFHCSFSTSLLAIDTNKELSSIAFIPNKGQWDDNIAYQANVKCGRIYLEDQGFTYYFFHHDDLNRLHPYNGQTSLNTVRGHAIKVNFLNSSKQFIFSEKDKQFTYRNYFIGKDSTKWKTNIQACKTVVYQNIYPGINLTVSSELENFKYDYTIKPKADPRLIKIQYEGCDSIFLENEKLILSTSVGSFYEIIPKSYQIIDGKEKEISCKYMLDRNTISFVFPEGYDKNYSLIIDPTLVFSTYTGSFADNWGYTATYDASGNAYSGGNVNDFGYPVTSGAYQLNYGGGGTGGNGWACDIAIAKFNPTGTSLIYATYLGGFDNEEPHSLVVDKNNDLLIMGVSYSSNYPVLMTAYDNTYNDSGDIVLSKLNSTGTILLGSTFIGGTGIDGVNITADFLTQYSLKFSYGDDARGEIIADSASNYLITAPSQSTNFPVTTGVFQTGFGGGLQDGVVFKIDNSLSTLMWSTFLGGNGDDACYSLRLDSSSNIFLTGGTNSTNLPTTPGVIHNSLQGGIDGFIVKLDSSATSVIRCSYIGTAAYDQTFFIELDRHGSVYVSGQSMGPYPVSSGVYFNLNSGQFIQKLDSQLTNSIFSTIIGSGTLTPNISITSFLVDTCDNIYLAGWGRCINFSTIYPGGSTRNMPVTQNAFQTKTDTCDFYFMVLGPNASSLLYATFFGGNLSQEHVDGGTSRFDKTGTIYQAICAGCGGFSDLPTTAGAVSSTNNSINCNNAIVKFDLELSAATATVQAAPKDTGCSPFTVQFNSTITSVGSTSFLWDFGDGSIDTVNTSPSHTYSNPGLYLATLYAFGTCKSDTVILPIIVDTSTTASFSFSKPLCDPAVYFSSTGANSSSYLWHFGDGDTSQLENPKHVYSSSGNYIVTLITNPADICPDTIVQVISNTTLDTTGISIPNVFSPNGDNLNDLFEITGLGDCHPFVLKIYNRWGRKVYETTDPALFWDGKIESKTAEEGIYYYILSTDVGDFQGSVTLMK